jgi:hypothetical protein
MNPMNSQTELRRQVHPSWIQDGVVTSQAFKPTPKDTGKLSTYHGDLISPEASWKHYTTVLQNASKGVQAVTVNECGGEGLKVDANGIPYKEHVAVDFTGTATSQWDKVAKRLKRAAAARGWQYQA